MNNQSSRSELETLVDNAQKSLPDEHENFSNEGSELTRTNNKKIFSVIFIVISAVIIYIRYPLLIEPYSSQIPANDPTVIETDLQLIAIQIESSRTTDNGYPESLDRIAFLQSLAEIISDTELTYQNNGNSFSLEWSLPEWQASYDSLSGNAIVIARTSE
jgi:hypothetical protein